MITLYVKEYAKAKGLTLKELCQKCGYQSYTSFIRQITNPDQLSMLTINKIAAALEIDANSLFVAPGEYPTLKCPYCGKPIAIKMDVQVTAGRRGKGEED